MDLGWIWTENLRPLVEILGVLVGYPVDDSVWAAFEVGLTGTDSEQGPWFDFPIGASTLRVAYEPEAWEMVMVAVDDADNALLERLVWTADLLRCYLVTGRG